MMTEEILNQEDHQDENLDEEWTEVAESENDDDLWDNEGDDVEAMKARIEKLEKQNQKLKEKKRKWIKKANENALTLESMKQFYREEKQKESFMSSYPELDYDVAEAVASKKWISLEEAVTYLWNQWKHIMWREVVKPKQKTDAELESRKKALGLV